MLQSVSVSGKIKPNNVSVISFIVSQLKNKINAEADMKKEKNILIAFLLNLFFSLFELIGGIVTGSVAIFSDSVHDLGDAVSIGIACVLERKAGRETDTAKKEKYSHLGGMITSSVLIFGSAVAIFNAVRRFFVPAEINYDGMLIFAVIGVLVNSVAAFVTHGGENMNIRAVNLHMLEDVLGWVTVLIGAVVMRLTDFYYIDPILSVGVSLFILVSAVRNLKGEHHHHH